MIPFKIPFSGLTTWFYPKGFLIWDGRAARNCRTSWSLSMTSLQRSCKQLVGGVLLEQLGPWYT